MSYYRREISPERPFKDFQDYSTAEKFYDLEESQRKYEELIQENLWLKEQIQRKKGGHVVEYKPTHYQQPFRSPPKTLTHSQNDMVLWSMIERNRYLEEKLEKLRKQQEKQARSIRKVECSEQWQNRHRCGPEKCYHQKYMQLLRVRSPFF